MDKKQPLLSLIIPVYNTEAYVKKCLDSIYDQTYKNIEIIIVNNGSKGNINEIVYNYQKKYTDRILKLVIHEKNIGTFHGRGSGMAVAEGDYFTFMDADDRIGVDYFYQMITKAEQTGSEIVMTDLVHEDETKYEFRYVIDPIRSMNIDLEGTEQIFNFYYSFAGRSYSMYGIWNKIYSRTLWDRCKPLIDAITEQFALCEDAEYTTIFFSQAKKITNLHGQFYYHYIYSGSASAGMASSYEKAERSIRFQGTAFRNMREHLKRCGLYEQYKSNFEIFRGFHQKCMLWHISNSPLKGSDKIRLANYCNDEFEDQKPEPLSSTDMFFTSHFVTQTNDLEDLREKIISDKYKVVSFDVFDTALVRSLWQPVDLFEIMNPLFSKLSNIGASFSNMRITAEKYAREKYCSNLSFNDEVTLDQIYDSLGELYNIDATTRNVLKNKELELEYSVCSARKVTKELYSLALRSGKIVIFVSDIYLPSEVVKNLLEMNEYTEYDRLYVSSELKATKASGNMYKIIKKDYSSVKSEEFLHIGDNFVSDIQMAEMCKWNTVILPKPVDVFCNYTANTYSGGVFNRLYYGPNGTKLSSDLFLRVCLGICSNRLFDNPYVKYNDNSDFNGDPYHMGILAGGMYVYGFCHWLNRQIKKINASTIVFVGEEMKLLSEIFAKLYSDIKCKLVDITSDAKTSLPIIKHADDLYSIPARTEITMFTVETLCNSLHFCLSDDFIDNQDNILEENGISAVKKIETFTQMQKVLNLLHDSYFDEEKAHENNVDLSNADAYIASGYNLNANMTLDIYDEDKVYMMYNPMFFTWKKHHVFCKDNRDYAFEKLLFTFLSAPETHDFCTQCILKVFDDGVNDFISDIQGISHLIDGLQVNAELMEEPMSYLIKNAKFLDRYVFAASKFNDISLSQYWEMNVKVENSITYIPVNPDYSFKEFAKARLSSHPKMFGFAKKVYHLFKRK